MSQSLEYTYEGVTVRMWRTTTEKWAASLVLGDDSAKVEFPRSTTREEAISRIDFIAHGMALVAGGYAP